MTRSPSALLASTLAACALGCETPCIDCLRGPTGVPKVELGGQNGPVPVQAIYLTPCSIELEFGILNVGETSTVTVYLTNIGSANLDMFLADAGLSSAYELNFGDQPPIVPGAHGEFTVSFSPSDAGPVNGAVEVRTDGVNQLCGLPDGGGDNLVLIALTGSGG